MQGGRYLDALIAEKILGWRECKFVKYESTAPGSYVENLEGIMPEIDVKISVPHFSTNIADAWLVVEKFRDINNLNSAVKFQKNMQMQTQGNIFHVSPIIICYAALKAVGVDID